MRWWVLKLWGLGIARRVWCLMYEIQGEIYLESYPRESSKETNMVRV